MTSTQPTVLCAWCGHVIRQGGLAISHGMCEGCANQVLAIIDPPETGKPATPLQFPVPFPRAS